jgi:putative methionine-R-sulfoxide reductase with GAF domain
MTGSGHGSDEGAERDSAFREALAAIAARSQIVQRLEIGPTDAVLRSVVGAAAALFGAEAASIALFDPDRDRLIFRVAAGEQGRGVVGVEIRTDEGLAGYVYSSGRAIAISDIANDTRFGRGVAEMTGYVPRSIVAVPLVDEDGTIGVLEVLDKRDGPAFSLRDVEMAGVFAHQATVAIRASRIEKDTAFLLATVVGRLAEGAPQRGVDEVVEAAVAGLCADDDPIWQLVEKVAAIRRASPEQLALVNTILDAVATYVSRGRVSRFAVGRAGAASGGSPGTSQPAAGEPEVDG